MSIGVGVLALRPLMIFTVKFQLRWNDIRTLPNTIKMVFFIYKNVLNSRLSQKSNHSSEFSLNIVLNVPDFVEIFIVHDRVEIVKLSRI